MKIYFAGSISGGRGDVDMYNQIIIYLKDFGEVLTEFIGDTSLSSLGEDDLNDKFIHDRDVEWLLSAEVLVAEVTTPSLGVGYEIGRALENGKKILCLYRHIEGKRISAMIKGAPGIVVKQYVDLLELKGIVKRFFNEIV
jgi:2'-deoxynucleoside 5'-phosphate N-hydrolase